MSDIQDLIHKITMDSIDKGRSMERERIIKSLEDAVFETNEVISKEFSDGALWAIKETAALIKGETNG
jgi:hypothetical protein